MNNKHVLQSSHIVLNALSDGFLSTIADNAVADVSGMENLSVAVNLVNRFAKLALALTHFDTVVRAKVAGATPHLVVVPGAATGAGTIGEVGNVVTLTYKTAVSTVAQMEALIATSTLIKVLTPGTQANVLATIGDDLADTALSLSTPTFTVLVEKSIDGTNFSTIATLTNTDFSTSANDSVHTALSDATGMPLAAKMVRARLTALGQTAGDVQLSMNAYGIQGDDYR